MEGLSNAPRRRRSPLNLPPDAINGRVSLILTAPDEATLGTLQATLGSLDHVTLQGHLPMLGGVVAQVPGREVYRTLDRLPADTGVFVDRPLCYPSPQSLVARDFANPNLPMYEVGYTAACADPGAPRPFAGLPDDDLAQEQVAALSQAEMSSAPDVDRSLVGIAKIHQMGYTGKGVGVAVVDSGIQPVGDLAGRVTAWKDLQDGQAQPFDDIGHGTHVAGEIAGSGQASHGKIVGVAPEANLIGVRIKTVAQAIQGLQWILDNKDRYGIRVVNLSLGDPAHESFSKDVWAQAVEKAIDAGLIVVAAAGNEGPDPGTVSTPGIDPRVITVGALDDRKTLELDDDRVAPFSSRGPTVPDGLRKPDILAPGVHVFSTLSPGSVLDVPELPHVGSDYLAISGTSMAAGLVSGVVADMLQANPALTQQEVKDILLQTARPMQDDPQADGAGELDGAAAVREAARRASLSPVGPGERAETRETTPTPAPATPVAPKLPVASPKTAQMELDWHLAR